MTKKIKEPDPVSLNCYLVRFNRKNQKEKISVKEAFGTNFKAEMKHMLSSFNLLAYENIAQNRMLHLNEVLTVNDTIVSGVMKRGYSGYEADIDEIENGIPKTLSQVKSDQYNSGYFYFLMSLPKPDEKYIIFIAQTYKQFGFKELFEEAYKDYIKIRSEEKLNVQFNVLSIPALFSSYLRNGDVRVLRFKKHSLSQNQENLLRQTDNKNLKDYEVETSIRAKKKGFGGVKSIDFENSKFVEVYNDLGFEYDEAYADISINGRKRTLNMTNPERFSASFDVSDKIKRVNGQDKINFKLLDSEAKKILKDEILISL